jgi:hypothetical protein
MARTFRLSLLLLVLAFAALPATASADIGPPWCGTPEAGDSAEALPDGTEAGDPEGSFPHIPHYAVACTLRDIERRSHGRMDVDVIGESVNGRAMYSVVINELRTRRQKRDYFSWLGVRALMLESPNAAVKLARLVDDDVKVPILVQGSIHGNEYEGVDSVMQVIEKYATTPRGQDPAVDNVLDHAVLVFNPIQNPDGRFNGVRQNANGFDLNRDYMTQSQPETIVSRNLMQRWLAPEMLDLHGYVEPMLIEATTKPHNPSIEYDLWLKWNQSRIDANQAALAARGWDVTRPINMWCPESEPNANGLCDNGQPGNPDVAEGWDDWGPFYAPMYHQHIGLDSSTVETCIETLSNRPAAAWYRPCGGRLGGREMHTTVQESTFAYVVANREEMLHDQLEMYRRGDVDAPRPECCPEPFDPEFHNWMLDYPQAYVIPVGDGQRSDAEANRLVQWALDNDIEVHELERDYRVGAQTFEEGSYVIFMDQPRRGLADTALSVGVDISDRIQRLYAPPAAWSHGALWGADTVTIPDGTRFSPRTDRIRRVNRLKGSVPSGKATAYTLRIDSPAAVRTLNGLVRDGVGASVAGSSALFGADKATRRALEDAARESGLDFGRLTSAPPADAEPIERVPRFAVFSEQATQQVGPLAGQPRVDQSTWVLRELGFDAKPVTTAFLNSSPTDPLADVDLIYNAASNYPANNATNANSRARLAAFFANGGGYIGGQLNGANFLANGAQVTGLAAAAALVNNQSNGRSGIVVWDNVGGAASPVTGAMPARDFAIVDPPTWLTSIPATMSVDGRLPASGFFVAGMWPSTLWGTAPGSAIIAHGTNTANTARLTVFANNPLYRADPEREWPMVAAAAYWGDN